MRHDMAKILVDRPRNGGGYAKGKRFRGELEDAPTRERMKDPYGYNTKSLNDHLAPLYNFLEKSCGRVWDKVYSEICKTVDRRTITGYHLLDHVDTYVARSAESAQYRSFFVDDAGILRKVAPWYYKGYYDRPKDPDKKELDPTTELRRVKSVWYVIKLAKVDGAKLNLLDPDNYERVRDAFTNKEIFANNGEFTGALYPRKGVRAVSKRQLGKMELRDLGLREGPASRTAG